MYTAAGITFFYFETTSINVPTKVPNIRGGKRHVATPYRNRILVSSDTT
jgi:hypothetical protein